MKLFDSFSTNFKDIDEDQINIYTCGPTVYDYIHIGNARPLILADTLVRYFDHKKIKYKYLLNITDIDDKIINKAIDLNITEDELVDKYKNAFLKNLNDLNIKTPSNIVAISSKIGEIINFIDVLIEKGYAYIVDGSVYFDISKVKNEYGKLSKQQLENLWTGVRVDLEKNKKNQGDFALWKKTDIGKNWLSKWSLGRPGWHTECALMIDHFFSETIDIHIGGIDLKFPHHENERVQYLAKNEKEIAKLWMHNGHLSIENVKMSKSLGNIITVNEFLEKYNLNTLRYIFLSSNYRQPLNISIDVINQAIEWNKKVFNLLKTSNWKLAIKEINQRNQIPIDEDLVPFNYMDKFNSYMEDDLNTPMVITLLDEMMKNLNSQIKDSCLDLCMSEFKSILDCIGFKYHIKQLTDKDIKKLNLWKKALTKKDYIKADKLRKELIESEII
ncbi:cysteinyl-tRNA synthetase [Spiroplasma litorale]|uniref:Cysteine--tRNA ligase n=1 Tax=Spiroplasma litorale TaxID=216942 RepID=A0A0K1W0Q9_9MOLU|nr:cysteine--tRNA ligase [Spiroplasma litorale]AKX33697.1 cysteinyl-tRNA synthetase [Spiroplasma litorale]